MPARKKSPRTIASVLSSRRGGLNSLISASKQLKQLKRLLDQILPPQLGAHYEVGGVRDGTLVLITDSAAWATKLRFSTPKLLQQLHSEGIRHIDVRQRPQRQKAPSNISGRKAQMSQDAAKQLKSLANTVSEPKLKLALERLAEHGKKHTDS